MESQYGDSIYGGKIKNYIEKGGVEALPFNYLSFILLLQCHQNK